MAILVQSPVAGAFLKDIPEGTKQLAGPLQKGAGRTFPWSGGLGGVQWRPSWTQPKSSWVAIFQPKF